MLRVKNVCLRIKFLTVTHTREEEESENVYVMNVCAYDVYAYVYVYVWFYNWIFEVQICENEDDLFYEYLFLQTFNSKIFIYVNI